MFPFWSYYAQSEVPTWPGIGVAVLNLASTSLSTGPYALFIFVVKLFAKKFQLFYPFTEYIATKLAEGIPSLKNLSPNPGAKLSTAPSAVDFEGTGFFASDNLIKP